MLVLSLDLSTTATGWALYDTEIGLIEYGVIERPKIKGITKLRYPIKQLHVIEAMGNAVVGMIKRHEDSENFKLDHIVIEEINRGINRIGQKSLDALHFVVLGMMKYLSMDLTKVSFIDTQGATGWRTRLKLKLSKEHRKADKKYRKKLPAQEYVNKTYGTDFDVTTGKYDSDICDAICIADAFVWHVLPKEEL